MLNSLPLFVGLRYVRARSHKFFVSFITWISLLCVCLGVTALIVILSVMNGLEGELRDRLLSLSAHARIFVPPQASGNPDWNALAASVRQAPNVTAAAPFIEIEALAVRKPDMLPVRLRGIDPGHEAEIAQVAKSIVEGKLADLTAGSDRVILGRGIAQMLSLGLGDSLTVLVPTTDVNGAPEPKLREFVVAGIFDTAVQDFDAQLLIAALDDVRALLPNPEARMSLHVNFNDALKAGDYSAALAKRLPPGVEIRDWTVDHASYFRAIRIEKTMVAVILMLIVAVAAFYLVAMLAMVVTDKRTDIAILRTLGTSPLRVMAIFLIQGGVIAWFGVALGVVLGCWLGYYAGAVAAFLERLFRFEFFDSDVYILTRIPSELRFEQIAWIAGIAMLITLMATIYPAFRASRVPPADALRYE
ncbi:MAG TPA: lipoprotein-releasing ABC transporter permease subunit [Steroidobacteraceae bacterium]|jgi:lipoprotein-releasing system permease protein|nr:lipoprotein-releasing ABC transporter permease subunit [Steroidobacteraceae bacterium]